MNNRFQPIIRRIICMILPIIVCSCSAPPPSPAPPPSHPQEIVKKQHPKPSKPYYEMDAYVKQLTIAKILLARNPYNIEDAITQLEIIQVFAAEQQTQVLFQPVIIISYRIKGERELKELVVPFRSPSSSSFPELEEILSLFKGIDYIMNDIHPAVVRNLPARNLNFPITNPEKIRTMINSELSQLIQTKSSFRDIDEAKIELHLLQFFMAHHMRDAAYLAAENAEQSLANAEKSAGSSDTINNLSSQLDMLEGQLHKEMPFTFSAF